MKMKSIGADPKGTLDDDDDDDDVGGEERGCGLSWLAAAEMKSTPRPSDFFLFFHIFHLFSNTALVDSDLMILI
jgi:hypothetical protein